MSIKFKSIQDPGNPEKERIIFSVNGDTEIGIYTALISDVSKDGAFPVAGSHLSYWFPDEKAKNGDLVVLYTKKGKDKSLKNSDGSSSHFYYWDLDAAKFGKSNVGIVLLENSKWEFEAPKTDSIDSIS